MNEFFASVFTTDDTGQIPMYELIFSGWESEELSETEVTRDEILVCSEKLTINKALCPNAPMEGPSWSPNVKMLLFNLAPME